MKRTVFSAIAVSLMVLSVACQQEAPQTDQQKQAQISEMMQDSSMVNMMMDHIASDYHCQDYATFSLRILRTLCFSASCFL